MSASDLLDPKRPWIIDPDDLPKDGITLRTMFSPFGESSTVPFKRAYMILLFLSLPFAVMLLMAATGGGGALLPLSALGVLSIFLTIAHVRRLNHAGRNPIMASLVALPIVLGFGVFALAAPPHVEEANKIVAQIEADRADPEGAAKRRAEERKAAQASAGNGSQSGPRARQGSRDRGGGQGRRGRRGGGGGGEGSGSGNFDPLSYVVSAASAWPARLAILSWIAVSFWSLIVVARLPRAKPEDL